MEYNDGQIVLENIEEMAKNYSEALKNNGFIFVKQKNGDIDKAKLEQCIDSLIGLYEATKKITISKKAYCALSKLEEEIFDVFKNIIEFQKPQKKKHKIENYCEGIKKIVSLLCEVVKILIESDSDLAIQSNCLLCQIKTVLTLIGDCKYRLMF